MLSGKKAGAARLEELKVEEFLDFVARMIARRWIKAHHGQHQKPSAKRDGNSNDNPGLPESRHQ